MELLLIFLGLGFGTPTTALAQTVVAAPVVYNASTSEDIIAAYAVRYGIANKELQYVVDCESQRDPLIRGDNGHSRGLVQISNIYHPEITDAQAFDPLFSLNYLASSIAKGEGHQWTCWRKYQGIK